MHTCLHTIGTYLPEGGLKSVSAAGPLPVAQPVAQPHQDCSDRATSCLSLSLEAYEWTDVYMYTCTDNTVPIQKHSLHTQIL